MMTRRSTSRNGPPPSPRSKGAPTSRSRRHWCRASLVIKMVAVILVTLFLATTVLLMQELEDSSENKSGFLQQNLKKEITVFADEVTRENDIKRLTLSSSSFQQAGAVNKHQVQPTSVSKAASSNWAFSADRQYSNKSHHTIIRNINSTLPPLPPFLDYMGVLLDAGRHFFPLEWLYDFFLPNLHAMGYNYVHFRLTDDQNFVVNLTVHVPNVSPQPIPMGYTARVETPPGIYQPQELYDLVRYAKQHYNITMIPEVNVPGHAGAWGAGLLPELVMKCPNFVCTTGYGVPLDVSNPILPSVVRQILAQVVELFDHPPLLHLGGDELHMSEKCLMEDFWWKKKSGGTNNDFDENARFNRTQWLYNDVQTFEEMVLKPIVEELGYNMDQILRWETTDSATATTPVLRTGSITHYWQTTPLTKPKITHVRSNGARVKPKKTASPAPIGPYMASTGLYLDVVAENGYGYGDYLAARALVLEQSRPFAVVVGTFELSHGFWEDRNVIGRLLAIRMGVSSSLNVAVDKSPNATSPEPITEDEFLSFYATNCSQLFLQSNDHSTTYDYQSMCDLGGSLRLDDRTYQVNWKGVWKEWKTGLCQGLTVSGEEQQVKPAAVDVTLQRQANYFYFDSLMLPNQPLMPENDETLSRGPQSIFHSLLSQKEHDSIPHKGIYLDLVRNEISVESFAKVILMMESIQLKCLQVRLADDFGQVVAYQSVPNVVYSAYSSSGGSIAQGVFHRRDLKQMVKLANRAGVSILPEINLATSGGGWVRSGMLMNCPQTLCHDGHGVAFDVVNRLDSILPVCMAVIRELLQVFAPSQSSLGPRIHLGADERDTVTQNCFAEAGHGLQIAQNALAQFEEKISLSCAAMGVDQDHIVRWNNQENTQYQNRTGHITQYLHDAEVVDDHIDSRYFGTVTIELASTPWEVFSDTKKWMNKSSLPCGLILKTVDGGIPSYSQMVAFHLALSEDTGSTSQQSFQESFEALCQTLDCTSNDLMVQDLRSKSPAKQLDLASSCLDRTQNVTVKLPKPSPFQIMDA